MNNGTFAKRVFAAAAAGTIAVGAFALAGCSPAQKLLDAGAHAYHETDTAWDLAYGWYEANTPEGFTASDNGTIFSTSEDRLYSFDNPGMFNTSGYQSIQVRLERGLIDDTEVKTTASKTAWSNDPAYENAVPFIEMKTAFKEKGTKTLGGRTWTVLEATPAVDASVTPERMEPEAGAKPSCKYIAQLDDTAYVVVDGYQIGADDELIVNFLDSMKTVDGNYYDTFEAWSFEHSISKKSPAGMW